MPCRVAATVRALLLSPLTGITTAPADIPWLLLRVVRSQGPGIFRGVTHIQRVSTVGGQFPTDSGEPGEVRNVAYTAEYYFYRAP